MTERGKLDAKKLVRETLAEIAALKVRNVPALRGVRRGLSTKLRTADPADVKAVALGLAKAGRKWLGYEIINQHNGASQSVTIKEIEALGEGMASWEEVDSFGVLLSGAAWLDSGISDADVKRWARSKDLWWRRAALVSTVVLNAKSRGGKGDTKRTLMICGMLVGDREDMIVKAMSRALRSLVSWDAKAVRGFLAEQDGALAARVKREVSNKLRTGLKMPKKV
ncbi:MAG TPA: DNA alkylation repair protein [Hyphomonadaceae bacterium]|jgi:3-methyladenine DNA glycosylase AlkD|nr:DNA alkylation repair protein [Hyphomonadaceae bacterium]